MQTNRMTALVLAGCQALLLWSMMPRCAAAYEAADLPSGALPVHALHLAQQEYAPGKWPGEYGTGSGSQGTTGPAVRPGGQGMRSPGMGPGMGPGSQGMMGPATEPGSQGMMGPGMGPGGPGMMGGPMSRSPQAMFGAIGALDLTDEQRSKFDAIKTGLNARLQEITDRINAESEKMRKLQQEQMQIEKKLNDLRGHMLQATMDSANHAEELLTDEQRQAMIGQGRHLMMQPRSLPYAGSQGGESE